jgi:hypothetical protein
MPFSASMAPKCFAMPDNSSSAIRPPAAARRSAAVLIFAEDYRSVPLGKALIRRRPDGGGRAAGGGVAPACSRPSSSACGDFNSEVDRLRRKSL